MKWLPRHLNVCVATLLAYLLQHKCHLHDASTINLVFARSLNKKPNCR